MITSSALQLCFALVGNGGILSELSLGLTPGALLLDDASSEQRGSDSIHA